MTNINRSTIKWFRERGNSLFGLSAITTWLCIQKKEREEKRWSLIQLHKLLQCLKVWMKVDNLLVFKMKKASFLYSTSKGFTFRVINANRDLKLLSMLLLFQIQEILTKITLIPSKFKITKSTFATQRQEKAEKQRLYFKYLLFLVWPCPTPAFLKAQWHDIK